MLVHKPGCHILSHPRGARPGSPGSSQAGPPAGEAERAARRGVHSSAAGKLLGIYLYEVWNVFSPHFVGADS